MPPLYTTQKLIHYETFVNSDSVVVPKGGRQRRLHKAILRYHDPANWPIIREALQKMGLARKLIGNKPGCLVPPETRGERDLQFRKGKNNSNGLKTSPGQRQEKRTGQESRNKGKQGLTRFSDNQFDDRKKSGQKKKSFSNK